MWDEFHKTQLFYIGNHNHISAYIFHVFSYKRGKSKEFLDNYLLIDFFFSNKSFPEFFIEFVLDREQNKRHFCRLRWLNELRGKRRRNTTVLYVRDERQSTPSPRIDEITLLETHIFRNIFILLTGSSKQIQSWIFSQNLFLDLVCSK